MNRYGPAATAELSGFSLDTLRYYERIGLLYDIDRTPGGQRVFTEDDLGWLGVLRCLRDTGMPIAQMLRYAELCRAGEHTLAERQAVLEQHAIEVDEKIAELRAQREHLREKIEWYRSIREPG
jgi:DNA-binding transcriptional MerR regulator